MNGLRRMRYINERPAPPDRIAGIRQCAWSPPPLAVPGLSGALSGGTPAEEAMSLFDDHQVPTEPVPPDEPAPEQNPAPDKDPVPDHNPVSDPA